MIRFIIQVLLTLLFTLFAILKLVYFALNLYFYVIGEIDYEDFASDEENRQTFWQIVVFASSWALLDLVAIVCVWRRIYLTHLALVIGVIAFGTISHNLISKDFLEAAIYSLQLVEVEMCLYLDRRSDEKKRRRRRVRTSSQSDDDVGDDDNM